MNSSYPQVIHRQIHVEYSIWLIFASLLLTVLAFCASAYALSVAKASSATAARALSKLSTVETSERLTPSKLAELSEFQEALSRAEELLHKVNRREIARAKARAEDGTYVKPNGAITKDQLRARAGLIAGRPAPHQ